MALCALLSAIVGSAQSSPASAPPPQDHPRGDHPHGPLPFLRPNIRPPKGDVPEDGKAVVYDATQLGSPLILDHNWRLGISHDLAPADPTFDDSQWPVRDAKAALAEIDDAAAEEPEQPERPEKPENGNPSSDQPPPNGDHAHPDSGAPHPHGHSHPYAWFRLHLTLPANHGPLVIFVRIPISRSAQITFSGTVGMELFANGKLVLPEGLNGPTPNTFQQTSRIYPINIPSDQTKLVLAVRIPFVPFGLDAYTGFFAHRTFYIGVAQDLRDHLDLWRHGMLFERIPTLVDCGLKLLLALFLIALFWAQKGHPEYLWLGLHYLVYAPLGYIQFIGSMGQMDQVWMAAILFQIFLISAYTYFEFLVAFLNLRKRWYILAMRYSAPLLLTCAPLLLMVRSSSSAGIGLIISALFCLAWVFMWVLFTGLTLTVAAIRRNYEAALLLLPLLLSIIGVVEMATTGSAAWLGAAVQSPLTFQAGPIPIHFSDIADFVGIFVIILIIFVRFLRIHRERERASSELAAARTVQELMIPQAPPHTPGYQVDTVYTPAAEVGGDFFHVQSTGLGGLLVILGDVAGHGLQAAMNVSMLMGAIRRSPITSPAQMLSDLNRVLVGSSSFTTCQIAIFAPSGEITIACAGHPPPYLNSQEIELPGGLPLGVIPVAEYEEVRLYLHPGDRLLMMSDGVAEARKANGELFGFERIRNLSSQSAFFIADAAKEFGQEDDITVLTVRRLVPNQAPNTAAA
ncbi:MAG TPA: SpoIIE family protein phosphatase [Acidobacteriaceae bacterium]|nr:SpoIIE family protein phosphatase [Acidobacteriaceae bacterium]